MKKIYITLILISLITFVPKITLAGGSGDDKPSGQATTCIYNDSRINAYIKIYENGVVTGTGYLVKDGQQTGRYRDEVNIGNTYTGTTCPEYVLVTYGTLKSKIAPFYASNDKSELENIVSDNGFVLVDFSEKSEINADATKGKVWAEIFSLSNKTEQNKEETKKCTYNDIIGCNNCQITIEFWAKAAYYDFGESIVKNYTTSSNINGANFEPASDWQKKKVAGWTVTPFSDYLLNNLCPEGLYMYYNASTKKINVYVNELKYNNAETKDPVIPNGSQGTNIIRLNYDSLCSDNNIKSAVKIIGYIILVVKWIVPLIIIVLGMVDFGKATISNDEKAINKATGALIRRCIAGIAIFFIPTIIMAVLNVIQISKGIEKDTDTTFGACTKCLLDPINSCTVSGGSNSSGGGGGNTGPDNPNGPNIEQTLK